MTRAELVLVRSYGKWLSEVDRIERLREQLNKAWTDKTPNNDPQQVTQEARDNVAKFFRQWVTSFVDQWATEVERGSSNSSE